jgi:hypothetical protein
LDRFIRLTINERNGGFTLYYLADPVEERYEPLISRRNPSTTFVDVIVNGRAHRLGSSRAFETRVERLGGNPIIIHESAFLQVNKIFTPVRTRSSPAANGVKLTITVMNKSDQEASVGLRFVIDTHLGEGRGRIPFVTDNFNITREIAIEGSSGERYWISHGENISLMGSIESPRGYEGVNEATRDPDYILFANWKRLSDVPWKMRRREGRAFNLFPYSIGDSAVSYYYEPEELVRGGVFICTIFLTTDDVSWYFPETAVHAPPPTLPPPPPPIVEEPPVIIEEIIEAVIEIDPDIQDLKDLQDILAQFLAGEIELDEHDLAEIEMSIDRLSR